MSRIANPFAPSGTVGQVFYPSVVVNLRLRFDESMQVREIPNIPAPLPTWGGELGSLINPVATPVVNAISSTISSFSTRPLITQRGANNLSFVANRVPKAANVELPAYRQAGKFSLTFDWRELPIDPRLLRAIGVEIYIGSVNPQDFASGMTTVGPNGVRRSILSTTDSSGAPNDDLLALAGLVDTWSLTRNEGSFIKLEGRDLRGVFLDSPIDPTKLAAIDLSRSLVDVIADILRPHPASQYLKILYNPDDWPTGAPPSVADVEGLTRVRQGAQRGSTPLVPDPSQPSTKNLANDTGKGIQGQTSDQKASFWDVITRYCFLVGAIPFFRGRNLVIRPAKSIFDQSKPVGQEASGNSIPIVPPTPTAVIQGRGLVQTTQSTWDPVFSGQNGSTVRYDDDGKPFTVRKFVYGRNIKELSYERKFTGTKVPVIELVSYDTSSTQRGVGKLLIAQWPPQDETIARMSGVSPSGDVAQTDKIQIPVHGVRDVQRLTGMARALYEEIGRGEFGGACKTGVLSSYKGTNSDPDVLRIRPGHAVEFIMDTRDSSIAPVANTELAIEAASFEDAVNRLKKQIGDENLARVIVASSRSAVVDQLDTMRTANVVFAWSQEEGIQTSFDFQNYLVARHDVGDKLGANTTPSVYSQVARDPKTNEPLNQGPTVSQQTTFSRSTAHVTNPQTAARLRQAYLQSKGTLP